MNTTPMVPVSIGELMDKWTILQIKSTKIKDPDKLIHIRAELNVLGGIAEQYQDDIVELLAELYEINADLWYIEDEIRILEGQDIPIPERILSNWNEGDFPEGDDMESCQKFVQYAREVYITNDKRCAIKRQINEALGSKLIEEKSYKE